MLRFALGTGALAASLFLAACPPADTSLDVTPSLVIHYFRPSGERLLSVDAGAYVDLEYTWKVGPDYSPPDGNLRAFVHFRDSSGRLIEAEPGKMLQDDHDIDPPPGKWKPGQAVIYPRSPAKSRMFKIPENTGGQNYIVTVYVGLYDPKSNHRAQLSWDSGPQPQDRAYPVAKFHVRNNREQYIYPQYDTTWHGPEEEHSGWRWSKKETTATFFRHPDAISADLVFSGHSPVEEIEGAQHMSVYVHEKKDELRVAEFTFDKERVPPTRITIPRELFSLEDYSGSYVRIIFEVDKFRIPDPDDDRSELGFLFYELLLLPRVPER